MFNLDETKVNYSDQYGYIDNKSHQFFNDTSLFGSEFLRFRPHAVIIYYDMNEKKEITIAGLSTTFINIANGRTINSGEHVNNIEKHKKIQFDLASNEYLVDIKLWFQNGIFYKICLQTQNKKEFSIGEERGDLFHDNYILNGNNIILSFIGRYNSDYLMSLGYHYISKRKFMQRYFSGYFILKRKIKEKGYIEKIENEIKDGKLDEEFSYLIKACQLPNTPFAEIIKYCTS